MDSHYVGMEDLEAFLAQDSLNSWPVNASAGGAGDMGSSSFDDWWDLHHGFQSDFFIPLEVADGSSYIQTQYDQSDLAKLPSYSLQQQDLQQGEQLLIEHLEQGHHPQQQQQQQQKGSSPEEEVEEEEEGVEEQEEEEEEEEEEGEGESDGKKQNRPGRSRNLVFERKRRKRLNQQLMTLRSLVPNITKMDKRSILVDAFGYLQNVLQETQKKLVELNLNSASSLGSASSLSSSSPSYSGEESSCTTIAEDEAPPVPTFTQDCDRYALVPTVTKMEACTLDEERFILKICCNKAVGAVGLVQKAIEMLAGLNVTCASVDELDDHLHMLSTTFLRVRKKGAMTQEKLLQQFRANATKLGLLL